MEEIRNCEKPSDEGYDPKKLEVEFSNIPAMAYFSQRAYDYYEPPFIPPEDFSPVASAFDLSLKASFQDGHQGRLEFLVVGSVEHPDQALMRIHREPRGYPFLDGRIFFFRHVKSFDPPLPLERVDRIGILGLTKQFEFGFFRQVDSLGAGVPRLANPPHDDLELDFQFFASPFFYLREDRRDPQRHDFCDSGLEEERLLGAMFYKELLIEAGSPAALASASTAKTSDRILF